MIYLTVLSVALALVLGSAWGYRRGIKEGRKIKAGEIAAHATLRANRRK